MIPQGYIQAWREHAPWPNPAQVEQDLIICRALCDLFNAPPQPPACPRTVSDRPLDGRLAGRRNNVRLRGLAPLPA